MESIDDSRPSCRGCYSRAVVDPIRGGSDEIADAVLAAAAAVGGSARLVDLCVGGFWVGVRTDAGAGMASALRSEEHLHGTRPVASAGALHLRTPRELAELLRSSSILETSIGLAAANALLRPLAVSLAEAPAARILQDRGRGSHVAMIGHFPFADRLRDGCSKLDVFERGLGRREGDLEAEALAEVLPQADVVAVTATTIINRTLANVLRYVADGAFLMMLGPTTPLTPALFEFGFDVLCGTVIDDAEAAMCAISQGAVTSQIPGVRRVALWPHRMVKGGKGEGAKGGGDRRDSDARIRYQEGITRLEVAEPDTNVIVRHRQLEVYRRSFELASRLYRLSVGFPESERYSLTDQIRRSSRSVCTNIAEAWRKRRYRASFQSSLNVAEAEAAETQTWIEFALDCGYISTVEARGLQEGYEVVIGKLVVMIKSPDTWLLGGQR